MEGKHSDGALSHDPVLTTQTHTNLQLAVEPSLIIIPNEGSI